MYVSFGIFSFKVWLNFKITCLSRQVWLVHGGVGRSSGRSSGPRLQRPGHCRGRGTRRPQAGGHRVSPSQGRVFAQVVDESKSEIVFPLNYK